jgi:hypothetical protein
MHSSQSGQAREVPLPEQRVRERAYSLWLARGSPHGNDWHDWLTATHQLQTESAAPPHPKIKDAVAAHTNDPAHRFHGTGAAHDARVDVVAGEARQRVRGRHLDSSLRPQPKKPR